MPQAYAAVIAYLAVHVVVRQILISIALTLLQKALQKRPARGAFATNVTVRSTIVERHLILGTARASGAILFYGTGDTTPNFLWFVVAYATHQCSALKDCWLDKLKVPAADINGSTGAVATATFNGKLKIWDHLGTQAQTVDTNIDASFAAWTSNHKLRGICYRVFRLERDADAWPTGSPQMFTSLVDGALLYDPRLDSTNGGSGSHRATDPSTWAFSHNWALAVRWFLSGGSVVNDQSSRMVKFGLQETDARIDDAYTIAAANIADQSLSGANAPPAGAEARYTCDIEVSCGQTRRDILEELLMCGGPGQLIYVHGKWRIYAGAYDSPVHTFTQDDIFGEMQIDDTTGDEDRFNLISAVHVDAAKEWNDATSPTRTNAAYVTQDGGQTIQREVQLRGVTSSYRAQRITERIMRDARQMRTIKFPFGRQGLKVAPWETFNFSHARYGWSSRVFRCIERDVQRTDEGGIIVLITAKAVAASVDTDLVTADYTTGTSATNSLQSEPPDAPTALTATSRVGAIEFNWTLGAFWIQNGVSQIWEYSSSTPFASATKIWEGRGTRAVITKSDSTIRYYWVRVATIGGQTSATFPATNGTPGVAIKSDGVCSDPEFALATDQSYWYASAGGGTSITITNTGGVVAGKVAIVSGGAGATAILRSRRQPPIQLVPGSVYTVQMRWRRTTSIGATAGYVRATAFRTDQDTTSGSFTGAENNALGGITLDLAALGAATLNDWQTTTGLAFFPVDPSYSNGAAPYVACSVVLSGLTVTNAIEIDYVQLTDGIGADPYIRTITSGVTLSDDDFMREIVYDSGSSGTTTLPDATNRNIGAKVTGRQANTGAMTIAVGAGDTLVAPPNLTGSRTLTGRYSRFVARVIATDTWEITGDL